MAGAEFAIKNILDGGRLNRVFLRFRVKIGLGRREQYVDAGGGQLVAVGLESARVLVEILVRPELQAIVSPWACACSIRLMWPACRLPMVGTKTTRPRFFSAARRSAMAEWICMMSYAE